MVGFAENKPGLAKPTTTKGPPEMEGNKATEPLGQENGRQVLGDIGNVVSAMPQRNPCGVGSIEFFSIQLSSDKEICCHISKQSAFCTGFPTCE